MVGMDFAYFRKKKCACQFAAKIKWKSQRPDASVRPASSVQGWQSGNILLQPDNLAILYCQMRIW
jgi:hypothetical protein